MSGKVERKMKFLLKGDALNILERVAVEIRAEKPTTETILDVRDYRLLPVVQLLGLEELVSVTALEDASQMREVNDPTPDRVSEDTGDGDETLVRTKHSVVAVSISSLKEAGEMPVCEICGKPVQSRRQKTCSAECKAEKQRRYARGYYHREKPERELETVETEDAGSVDPSPLPEQAETMSFSGEWPTTAETTTEA